LSSSGPEVVIVEGAARPPAAATPKKGYYKDTHPNALLGTCYTEVIERAGIDPAAVEDVICGCVQQ
jgi:acetyl-CoA acyltransferase